MTSAPTTAAGTLTVTHVHGERVSVRAAGGSELMAYVYAPDPDPFESRKPYAHPLRTLGGRTVTGYRPNDHRWHKGLQMTASHLSGQNFWGGNSYVHGEGYLPLRDRVGSMRHDGFDAFEVGDAALHFTERLTWVENGGAEWASETRSVALHSVDTEAGAYALDWSIELTNTRDEPLHFGSPTTHGREMAGYTGLHWRGPRAFTGGQVLVRGGPSTDEAMMGQSAADHPWLGFVGEHDDVDGHATVVFAHAPENAEAVHPSHWFVRSEPTPTVAFSWAFFEEFELPPGDSFRYRYRVLIADGAWEADAVDRYLSALPW
ncbi:PmoA family protein [Streptomyces smyrnaeus]|nr:PmoA family protein [Streptomyces smyrnaeus]